MPAFCTDVSMYLFLPLGLFPYATLILFGFQRRRIIWRTSGAFLYVLYGTPFVQGLMLILLDVRVEFRMLPPWIANPRQAQ